MPLINMIPGATGGGSSGATINDTTPSTSSVYSSSKTESTYEPKNSNIQSHINNTINPHNVSKSQVGLGDVDNTSDLDKPISNAVSLVIGDINTALDTISGQVI